MSLRRATGQAPFADDHLLPGALHVAVRHSPFAHARLTRVDASSARALPGVVAVFTPASAPAVLGPVVRFVGDRVAVVAAEDLELALRAADAVEVEAEPLAPCLDGAKAIEDPEAVAARLEAAAGDVTRAFAEADRTLLGRYRLASAPALPLEPRVVLTWFDEDHRLVVRTSTESPFRVRRVLAERLGLPAAQIRVVQPLVGGGVAGRSEAEIEDLCALVTLETGRPARLAVSLRDELTTAAARPAQEIEVRLGLRGGRLHGLDVRLRVDAGAVSEAPVEALRAAGRDALRIYRVPHLRYEGLVVRTNHPPASLVRATSGGVAFAVESAISEAAAVIGEDAVSFRRRHLQTEAAASETHALRAALGEPSPAAAAPAPFGELLRVGARDSGWGRRGRLGSGGPDLRRGCGVALARRTPATTSGSGGTASLRLLEDGSFSLAAGPSLLGAGDESTYAEAAAAILGVPARRVVSAVADTDWAPFDPGVSSAAFVLVGQAVEEAARLMRAQIVGAGARLLEVEPSRVVVDQGLIRAREGRAVSFAEVGSAALRSGAPIAATAAPAAESAPSCHAAVFAEVEVDLETGIVSVLDLHCAADGGPFADPHPAEGRLEGALVAGLGQALAEGMTFDPAGHPLVSSLGAWPFPAAIDGPALSVTFLPTNERPTRFGASAIGEAASHAALAAIAAAVSRATGRAMRELPLLPERVGGPPGAERSPMLHGDPPTEEP